MSESQALETNLSGVADDLAAPPRSFWQRFEPVILAPRPSWWR